LENTHVTLEQDIDNKNWQILMFSCRQACKLLGIEYQEPEYLNWKAGRSYYEALWGQIKYKRISRAATINH